MVAQAAFIDGGRGALFRILYEPASQFVRGSVLYVHPFAEELNKSRRMVALQARRLTEQGYAVLVPDLCGCGDSGGDFADASWDIWLQDLGRCVESLRARYRAPLILWGLRAGCLLISDLLQTNEVVPAATLFWQPVINGEVHLTQFLRLRMAAGMMVGAKETTAQLRARLDAGEVLEVAGYDLSPGLAAPLALARLQPPTAGPLCWLEVSQAEPPTFPPASTRVLDIWQQEGLKAGQNAFVRLQTALVQGEPFWATQEIREVPALLAATERVLREALD